ncbi:hypothetical protein POM88_028871 [Heracleum sosnowskyi]|uniref:Uncharacterized protein n=1 Tax=Heracleum sosnowskyi TaxID=360622 RepID=A0AAD8MHZ7_9APIA|nr:hypothetical protein POM88_028871 [Heracleum sosnowskyi]
MEGVSRKRGRPRVVVTEAVAEARRLAVQQRNLRRDRRKRDPAIASSSASAGPTTTESMPLSSGVTAIGTIEQASEKRTGQGLSWSRLWLNNKSWLHIAVTLPIKNEFSL